MKYVIIFLMLCMIVFAQQKSDDKGWNNGFIDGQLAGGKEEQMGWMAGSCGAGLLAGCLGSGVVWAVASGDLPEYVPEGTAEYKMGYVEGYKEASKSKKRGAAMVGGVIGFLINTTAIILILTID